MVNFLHQMWLVTISCVLTFPKYLSLKEEAICLLKHVKKNSFWSVLVGATFSQIKPWQFLTDDKFNQVKARLHRRFLSRQLYAIFVALKLHQVSNMFETPCDIAAINRTKNRTWFTRAILKLQLWARQKLHRVAAKKIACVNGPLQYSSNLVPNKSYGL